MATVNCPGYGPEPGRPPAAPGAGSSAGSRARAASARIVAGLSRPTAAANPPSAPCPPERFPLRARPAPSPPAGEVLVAAAASWLAFERPRHGFRVAEPLGGLRRRSGESLGLRPTARAAGIADPPAIPRTLAEAADASPIVLVPKSSAAGHGINSFLLPRPPPAPGEQHSAKPPRPAGREWTIVPSSSPLNDRHAKLTSDWTLCLSNQIWSASEPPSVIGGSRFSTCNLWIADLRKVFVRRGLLHLKHASRQSCSVHGAFKNKVWPFVAE